MKTLLDEILQEQNLSHAPNCNCSACTLESEVFESHQTGRWTALRQAYRHRFQSLKGGAKWITKNEVIKKMMDAMNNRKVRPKVAALRAFMIRNGWSIMAGIHKGASPRERNPDKNLHFTIGVHRGTYRIGFHVQLDNKGHIWNITRILPDYPAPWT